MGNFGVADISSLSLISILRLDTILERELLMGYPL